MGKELVSRTLVGTLCLPSLPAACPVFLLLPIDRFLLPPHPPSAQVVYKVYEPSELKPVLEAVNEEKAKAKEKEKK